MSLSWNDPQSPIKSARTSSPGFLEAQDKALSCFWCSHVRDPQIYLWHLRVGFWYDRPRNGNSTAPCGYTGQKTHEGHGSALAAFTETSALRSTRKQQGSKDRTASPVSIWPCHLHQWQLWHAKRMTHRKPGVPLGLRLRKWQPPLGVNGTLPKGLGRAKMPLPICWFPPSLRLDPKASFT